MRSTTGSSSSATTGAWRACSASTSATATSAWTCADDRSPPQRADARRVPAARRLSAPGARRGGARGRPAHRPTANCRSAATGSRMRCATAGWSTATASPCSRPTRLRCSRRTTPCRSPAACWSRSTRAWRRPRSITSCATPARASLLVDHALAPLVEPLDLRPASTSSGSTTAARAGRPVRAAARDRRARAARELARARGGADLDQLHLGHDGRAQGRRLHASRRLSERAGRGHRRGAHARERVPLDAADVPLQRLVLPLGCDRGGGASRDRARGRRRPRLGADRARGRDALQRRADRAHRRDRSSRQRTGWSGP